jgi:hypothetical protein
MEILSSLNEIKIANSIRQAIDDYTIRTTHSSELSKVKSELKTKCNIIYFNILSSSSSELKIMAKTKEHSYIYNYDLGSKEINLVGGIRKNVVTN